MTENEEGLIIGRFQPFHKGHKNLVDKSQDKYQRLILGIGKPDKISRKNPLTYREREVVLEEEYGEEIPIFEINDQGDPELWIQEVENKIGIDPEEKDSIVAITGNDYTAFCFANEGYQVEKLEKDSLYKPEIYNGEKIREIAKEGGNWEKKVPSCTRKAFEKMDLDLGKRIESITDILEYEVPDWISQEPYS